MRAPSSSCQSHFVVWPSDETDRETSWSAGLRSTFEPVAQ